MYFFFLIFKKGFFGVFLKTWFWREITPFHVCCDFQSHFLPKKNHVFNNIALKMRHTIQLQSYSSSHFAWSHHILYRGGKKNLSSSNMSSLCQSCYFPNLTIVNISLGGNKYNWLVYTSHISKSSHLVTHPRCRKLKSPSHTKLPPPLLHF